MENFDWPFLGHPVFEDKFGSGILSGVLKVRWKMSKIVFFFLHKRHFHWVIEYLQGTFNHKLGLLPQEVGKGIPKRVKCLKIKMSHFDRKKGA